MPLFLLLAVLSSAAAPEVKEPFCAPWGTVHAAADAAETFLASVNDPPVDGKLRLPAGLPPIVMAFCLHAGERVPLALQFSENAEVCLQLPTELARLSPAERTIVLETAAKNGQRADGTIVLGARDAQIAGRAARLESQPGHERIESWTDPAVSVSWDFKATRPGMYQIELSHSLADNAESHIEIELADATVSARLTATKGWDRYLSQTVGRVYVAKTGEQQLHVRCTKKTGPAVMNLKAVILRPTCEGKPIVQANDGSITCHARDVTIHGVQVQYEPKPEKNTVGYWTNVSDRVSWDFTLKTPGHFNVEILQGCGKGQGGSDVELTVDGQPLRFVVEDTGHFQNFVPRTIGQIRLGRAGRHTILVRPLRKAGVAVMDLRQVRLVPCR